MLEVLKRSYVKVTMLVAVMMISIVGSAFAEEVVDTETVASMTAAFGNVKATALAALGAIATIAILLFAGIYAWRYGKKVFSIVAR